MSKLPLSNGDIERDNRGRFAPGNRGGPGGNAQAMKASKFRATLYSATSISDIRAIARKLIEQSRDGDHAAIKILFDRLLGPSVAPDLLEKIEALEKATFGREYHE